MFLEEVKDPTIREEVRNNSILITANTPSLFVGSPSLIIICTARSTWCVMASQLENVTTRNHVTHTRDVSSNSVISPLKRLHTDTASNSTAPMRNRSKTKSSNTAKLPLADSLGEVLRFVNVIPAGQWLCRGSVWLWY